MRREQPQESHRAISTVASGWIYIRRHCGCGNQTEVDKGTRPDTTIADAARITELERENRD
jgi:hypothetical protein